MVLHDCGCWIIRSYGDPSIVLRFQACKGCIAKGLDRIEHLVYLDKVDSVSAPDEDEGQLWLT